MLCSPQFSCQTPPFLLTLWLSQGGVHQPASAYRHPASHAANQVQIYTWLDTTLKDLVTLFLSARATPASQLGPTHKISFRHVYWEPDTEVWTTKEVGQLSHRDVVKPASEARGHALKTLDDFGCAAVPTPSTSELCLGSFSLSELAF